jgi:plasmid stability protein
MPQVLVRSLDKATVNRLKERAKRNGRSLQAELKAILESAVGQDLMKARWVAQRIRKALKGRTFSDSGEQQAEDRLR